MTFTDRQEKFLEFVKESHGFQVRKYTGEPYWTHVVAVAGIVSEVTDQDGLVEVALGHDLLEDTDVTVTELYEALEAVGYGDDEVDYIVEGIRALTDVYVTEDYPTFNRKKRKVMESRRLWEIKPDFQTVKYADLIHNSSSILSRDPGFAKVYLSEKKQILEGMKFGDRSLYDRCQQIVSDASEVIEI